VAAAFDDYVRRNGQRLVRTAYLLTGDRNAAEDIVQNAFTSVLTSWRRLRDVSNLDAYMYSAVVNARTRWWQRGPRAEIPSAALPERADGGGLGRVDEYDEMMTALGHLAPRQRAVLVLRFYEDLSEADVAAILGCSQGTVKSQTARALERLRTAMIKIRTPVPDAGGPR
jgi:RNA polymerase sigma-70 factor (sigma-E family)